MKFLHNLSIRYKLILLLFVFALVPIGITGVYIFEHEKDLIVSGSRQEIHDHVQGAENELEYFYQYLPEIQMAIARTSFVVENAELLNRDVVLHDSKQGLRDFLTHFVSGDMEMFLLLHPETGEVLCATEEREEGKFYDKRPYFTEGRKSEVSHKVHYSFARNKNIFSHSSPVKKNGRTVGILVGFYDLKRLNRMLGHMRSHDFYFVTHANLYLSSTGGSNFPVRSGVFTKAVENALKGETGADIYVGPNGDNVIGGYAYIDSLGLVMVSESPLSAVLRNINLLRNKIIWGVLVISLAAFGGAIIIGNRIAARLQTLSRASRKISEGEFDTRVDISYQDEIGMLADSMNLMADGLQAREASLREELDQNVLLVNAFRESEEKLRETSARLRLALDSGHLGIWDWDIEANSLLWDDRMFELYGITRDMFNVCVEAWENGVHPEDRPMALEAVQSAIRGERDYDIEFRVVHPDGNIKFIKADGLVTRGSDGKALHLIGLNYDITDMKSASMQLQEAFNRYREILESISDGFFSLDNALVITYFNKAAEDLLGRKREDVLGHDIFEAFPEAKGSVFEDNYRWAVKEKQTISFEIYFGVSPYENWYDVRVYPHEDGISVFFQVTTERKKAEEALLEGERKYRLLFENMTVGFALHEMIYDEEGRPYDYRYLEANSAFEKLTGIPLSTLIGKTIRDVIPDIEQYWIETFGEVAKTGKPVSYENYVHELDKYYDTWVFSPDKDRFAVVFNDITFRKNAETELERLNTNLKEKNEELEQVLYAASHDLRSPLVNIQGFSSELEDSYKQVMKAITDDRVPADIRQKIASSIDEEIPEALAFIASSTDKMDALLSGLLKLSRLGRSILNMKYLDMEAMMREIQNNYEFIIKGKGIRVQVEALPRCYGDDLQINQVFSNVFENALRYHETSREGFIRVSGIEDGPLSVYCIEDNGIGIKADQKDRIFQLFYRCSVRDEKGEGIGLAMARKILSRHGGRIRVESEAGKGSRFYISIPRERESRRS